LAPLRHQEPPVHPAVDRIVIKVINRYGHEILTVCQSGPLSLWGRVRVTVGHVS